MSDRDVFFAYLKAYNAKDVPGMLASFDEACVFENISDGKVTVRTEGKAELDALARRSAEAFAWREQKIVSLIEGHGQMAAEISFQGILQADLSPELKTGTQMKLRCVSVCELTGGKIVRLSDYS